MRRTVPWRAGVPMYRCASVPSGRRRWKLKRPGGRSNVVTGVVTRVPSIDGECRVRGLPLALSAVLGGRLTYTWSVEGRGRRGVREA